MPIGTILRGVGLGLVAMALDVAVAFVWVWLYSLLVAPGHDAGFYADYARHVAPISAIVAGAPILFVAGYLAAHRAESSRVLLAALMPAITYILVDAALLSLAPAPPAVWATGLSYLTKLAAAAAGGWVAVRGRVLRLAQ